MLLIDLQAEATRQLTICNACRYCEGYCAVFPALEIRRDLERGDLVYLANLCHDCRACYYACMYAPPHEFGVNVPKVLSAVREETYSRYSWPRFAAKIFARGALWTILACALAAVVIASGIALFAPDHRLFGVVLASGSFYEFVPYLTLVSVFLALGVFVLVATIAGALSFWRDTSSPLRDLLNLRALRQASRDALKLRYMRGGGDGCFYPSDQPSPHRRIAHSLVFYGFFLDLAATATAALMQDVWRVMPPYPLVSVPVVLGVTGGVMLVLGTSSLIWLKERSDTVPSSAGMRLKDYALLTSLDLVAITGFLILGLRTTSLLGVTLAVHLASVGVLFLTMPYGKFVHFGYRYLALVQNALESHQS
jgi:citrate/tricarballylate utilization protein